MNRQHVPMLNVCLLIIKCSSLKEIEPKMVYPLDNQPAPLKDQSDILLFYSFRVTKVVIVSNKRNDKTFMELYGIKNAFQVR
jgi:hypothetical protein